MQDRKHRLMIRVCHIASGDLWAGAEAMICQLLKGLREYPDMEVSAVLLNEGRLAGEIRKLGLPLHVVHENGRTFARVFRDVRSALMKISPDIIHSHRHKENILACLASKTRRGARLVATQHGMPELRGSKDNLKYRSATKLNFFILSRYFTTVVAVSGDMRKVLDARHGLPAHKIKVIRNGIAMPACAGKAGGGGPFVIGSSGRFFPVKDYPLMVETARHILRRTKGIGFKIAGDGPEMPKIRRLIQEYGMAGAFSLEGFTDDLPAFYQGLDLYLNTSLHEGIPMSVLEAMAHGLPVVAPRVGGLPEILEDGVQGFLVDGRSPGDFARRCLRLYANRPLRERMSRAAQKRIAGRFTAEHMAGQYREAYLDAMKIRRDRPLRPARETGLTGGAITLETLH